jgi:hypothetical protein|tara:strand:- start:1524 stop:1736 length:213 start_codon:yes stop_codon:yes gene_type:complete
MKQIIDTNRKSWFTVDAKLKRFEEVNNVKPKVQKRQSLLQKKQDDVSTDNDELDVSARYVKFIREQFKET